MDPNWRGSDSCPRLVSLIVHRWGETHKRAQDVYIEAIRTANSQQKWAIIVPGAVGI